MNDNTGDAYDIFRVDSGPSHRSVDRRGGGRPNIRECRLPDHVAFGRGERFRYRSHRRMRFGLCTHLRGGVSDETSDRADSQRFHPVGGQPAGT